MARVTVEDCVLQVPNRFDLVMLAAQRAEPAPEPDVTEVDVEAAAGGEEA